MTLYFQFGALTPLEPRLGRKLIEPLTNLIHRYLIYSKVSVIACNSITTCNLVLYLIFYVSLFCNVRSNLQYIFLFSSFLRINLFSI